MNFLRPNSNIVFLLEVGLKISKNDVSLSILFVRVRMCVYVCFTDQKLIFENVRVCILTKVILRYSNMKADFTNESSLYHMSIFHA